MGRPEKTILLDANLLVLLVVGTTSKQLIAKHKKTKAFAISDFERLVATLGHHRVVVLPHVAAEASNLIAFHQEPEAEILTTDAMLHVAALKRGRVAVNFNHLR